MKAAVHLGKDYEEHLHATQNTEFCEIQPLFSIKHKLILDQEDEIFGVTTIYWDQTLWMRSTLTHEHAVRLSTTRVFVFSDSVLCLGGRIAGYPQSV